MYRSQIRIRSQLNAIDDLNEFVVHLLPSLILNPKPPRATTQPSLFLPVIDSYLPVPDHTAPLRGAYAAKNSEMTAMETDTLF